MNKQMDSFDIKLSHVGSLYDSFLRDVDGNRIKAKSGKDLSLYTSEIRLYVANREVRFIYDVSREFRYIITSEEQYNRFRSDLCNGSPDAGTQYYVYFDADASLLPIRGRRRECGKPKHNRRAVKGFVQ